MRNMACIALTLVQGGIWWLQKAAETRQNDNNLINSPPQLGGLGLERPTSAKHDYLPPSPQ
jgi:hypothetical protein